MGIFSPGIIAALHPFSPWSSWVKVECPYSTSPSEPPDSRYWLDPLEIHETMAQRCETHSSSDINTLLSRSRATPRQSKNKKEKTQTFTLWWKFCKTKTAMCNLHIQYFSAADKWPFLFMHILHVLVFLKYFTVIWGDLSHLLLGSFENKLPSSGSNHWVKQQCHTNAGFGNCNYRRYFHRHWCSPVIPACLKLITVTVKKKSV